MKVPLFSLTKEKIKEKELPMQFEEEIRPDLIKRAVLAIQSGRRQPYGASPEAGKRASATISKRRHSYKTSYGHGISRVPRKILSRRGTRFNWVGAFAPGTVGGRRAHPPKAEKVWLQKINKKEKRKAIRSAIAATMADDIVKKNYITPNEYPFIIDTKIEMISKTKEALGVLGKLGLKEEIEKSKRKIRAGAGKLRGRKYKAKKGPLFVVSKECGIMSALKNIPGVDAIEVNMLNAEILAPGANPGRLTIFTEAAIDRLQKERLFM